MATLSVGPKLRMFLKTRYPARNSRNSSGIGRPTIPRTRQEKMPQYPYCPIQTDKTSRVIAISLAIRNPGSRSGGRAYSGKWKKQRAGEQEERNHDSIRYFIDGSSILSGPGSAFKAPSVLSTKLLSGYECCCEFCFDSFPPVEITCRQVLPVTNNL